MAVGVDGNGRGKGLWVLVLATVGAASGALARYPLFTAASGLTFLVLFALALVLLGWPLVMAEAALGQFRRRNVVDAFGPGPWTPVGGFLAVGAFLTAVVLAVIAGYFGRFAIDAFQGDNFDDPARHFRLFSAGWDAMLGALVVLIVATGAALAGAGKGLRATVSVVAVAVLLVLVGLAAWTSLQSGAGEGRDAFLVLHLGDVDAALVLQAALQALLPTAVGLGLVATLSSRMHDRTLPRDATLLVAVLVSMPLVAGLFFASLASANGQALAEDGSLDVLFDDIPVLFASLGEQEGGILSGLFYGSLLAASLVAIVALLEVPAAWLNERYEQWTPKRSTLGVGLAAYLVAIVFSFGTPDPHDLHLFLAGIVAPLGGLLTAIHVGWIRPEVLDGFRVGEAHHKLDAFLRPWLRFAMPPALAFLLLIGLLSFLAGVGALERGSAGLWSLVP